MKQCQWSEGIIESLIHKTCLIDCHILKITLWHLITTSFFILLYYITLLYFENNNDRKYLKGILICFSSEKGTEC